MGVTADRARKLAVELLEAAAVADRITAPSSTPAGTRSSHGLERVELEP